MVLFPPLKDMPEKERAEGGAGSSVVLRSRYLRHGESVRGPQTVFVKNINKRLNYALHSEDEANIGTKLPLRSNACGTAHERT